ncbi:MAG: VOC family protein, partial [Granulosicoccus sp.]|nr:VOC family protein [Granulosicoccus sp.]
MSSPISPHCRLDHLVIAATDCATGVDWFHHISGISLPAGGQHLQMGTHNHVTALSRHAYLELIAIDESVTAPALPQGHSRWFGLDDSACQARLTDAPCLLSWAVATTDLDATLITVRNAGIDPGQPVSMSRGDLHWRLALRPDGS